MIYLPNRKLITFINPKTPLKFNRKPNFAIFKAKDPKDLKQEATSVMPKLKE